MQLQGRLGEKAGMCFPSTLPVSRTLVAPHEPILFETTAREGVAVAVSDLERATLLAPPPGRGVFVSGDPVVAFVPRSTTG